MSGLTKEEKLAKREANKRPTDKTKPLPWIPVWNSSRFGAAKAVKVKPYENKSDRRRVLKKRRERKEKANAITNA